MTFKDDRAVKATLKARAKENTSVAVKTPDGSTALRKGIPNDHSRKHLDGKVPTVGVSLGVTKNMDNYESLRVDVWLTDKKGDDESIRDAYSRITQIATEVLEEIVAEYV